MIVNCSTLDFDLQGSSDRQLQHRGRPYNHSVREVTRSGKIRDTMNDLRVETTFVFDFDTLKSRLLGLWTRPPADRQSAPTAARPLHLGHQIELSAPYTGAEVRPQLSSFLPHGFVQTLQF